MATCYLLDRPTLAWNAASGASGYILRLMNDTTTLTQRSWIDSGFTGCTLPTICWTPNFDLDSDVLFLGCPIYCRSQYLVLVQQHGHLQSVNLKPLALGTIFTVLHMGKGKR